MTLPYSTNFPKPGDTLTAAQANSLPVGSEIRNPSGIIYTKSATMGWLRKNSGDPIHNGPNVNCDHWATLVRVGPPAEQTESSSDDGCDDAGLHNVLAYEAAMDDAVAVGLAGNPMYVSSPTFTVGQVVTREQLDALPDGAVMLPETNDGNPDWSFVKTQEGWQQTRGPLGRWQSSDFKAKTFTIISLPTASPACPHAVGTLEWAHWMAKEEGKCVKCEGSLLFKFIDGRFHYIEEWPGPWSIVPDPSAPIEPPAPAETPVVHIDPTDICAALDKALPEWRGTMTVAQAVGELNLRLRLHQAIEADLCEEAETLERERDAAISEIGKSCATMAAAHADEIKGIAAERDRLRLESMNYEREGMKALEQRDAREAMLDRFVDAMGGTNECGEHSSNNCPWHVALDRAETLTAERDAALARADAAEAMRDFNEGRLQAARNRAEAAEARLVVPEGVQKWATYMVQTRADHNIEKRAAAFILSLADHLPETKKKVQSHHPEGTREWAEDAMRQGFSVANAAASDGGYWSLAGDIFARSKDIGFGFNSTLKTGWRIHTPAVAPEPLPSIAQIWARIAAIEERLGDVEAGV